MAQNQHLKLLFIINPGSGNNKINWREAIHTHFVTTNHTIEVFDLPDQCDPKSIQQEVQRYQPDRVVAVGGDGTVKLTAQGVLHTDIPLAILPAGSANGLAKELDIPIDIDKAMNLITTGVAKAIHVIKINGELCIHLSDIGFNAFVVKKFETGDKRGMFGYLRAAWQVLWKHPVMQVEMQVDGASVNKNAAMIVIANATKYGTGALINPNGKLDDEVFEVIVVKKISVKEIFKMVVSHLPYDHRKTEVFQTSTLYIHSKKQVHFQVDGEYMGKVDTVNADILPGALKIIVADDKVHQQFLKETNGEEL